MELNFEEFESPGLLVFPEVVDQNIDWAITQVGGKPERLRPHIKTHKTLEANKKMLEKGINKFKCATIAEAELLVISGAKDILLAMQPVGPNFSRFLKLINQFHEIKFSCLIDNIAYAKELNSKLKSHSQKIRVFMDINLGMNRTGIPLEKAYALAETIENLENLELIGIQAYDGHIRDTDFLERINHAKEDFIDFWTVKSKLDILKLNLEFILGGTPSFLIHAEKEEFTCSPGTFIFFDAGYSELFPENTLKPAVYVLSRIISIPNNTTLCLDLGHKAIASENPIYNRIRFLDNRIIELIGQSEEHGIVSVKNSSDFKIGDCFLGIPFHVCPTVALHQSLQVVANGKKIGEWLVRARDRKLTI